MRQPRNHDGHRARSVQESSLRCNLASAGHGVEHAGCAVGRGANELRARGVEADVKDLVVVPPQRVDALPRRHVPHFTRPVNRPANAQVGSVVELPRHRASGGRLLAERV